MDIFAFYVNMFRKIDDIEVYLGLLHIENS